jgi:hypothetical protein
MSYAPRDTKLGRKIAGLVAQDMKGVVFLGRGGDVLARVDATDYSQYVAVRKSQIQSPKLKAIAYLNLSEDQMIRTALVENREGSETFLTVVHFDAKGHWFAPLPGAMATAERLLGKEEIAAEDDN